MHDRFVANPFSVRVQRNTRQHIRRLKGSGKPEVLTVNGRAAVVVQSAEGYQKLLEAADLAGSVRTLRRRLDAANRGEAGIPAKRVLAEVRQRLGLRRGGAANGG